MRQVKCKCGKVLSPSKIPAPGLVVVDSCLHRGPCMMLEVIFGVADGEEWAIRAAGLKPEDLQRPEGSNELLAAVSIRTDADGHYARAFVVTKDGSSLEIGSIAREPVQRNPAIGLVWQELMVQLGKAMVDGVVEEIIRDENPPDDLPDIAARKKGMH